jgi:hypothetical protein
MAKGWSIYLDEDSDADLEVVRAYYNKKNEGRPVSDSQVGRNLLREKKADIINERTRSLTLAKVYEEVASMRAELAQMLALLKEITTNV